MPAGRTARSGGGASWKRSVCAGSAPPGSSNDGGRQRQVRRGGEPRAVRVGLEAGPPAQLVDRGRRRPDRELLDREQPGPTRATGISRASAATAEANSHDSRSDDVGPPGVDRQLDARQRRAGADAAEQLAQHDLVGLVGGGRAERARTPARGRARAGRRRRWRAGPRARRAAARRSARRRGSRGRRGAGRGRRGRAGRGGRRRRWRRGGRACPPQDGRRPPAYSRAQRCRCSISSPRAISTSWTSSGGNSPWSITPGVADSRAASSAGSSNAPR